MTRPGWFRVPRAIRDTRWFRDADPFTRDLWLLLVTLARFKFGTTEDGLNLQSGQFVTSWRALAEEIAWIDRERHQRVVPSTSKLRRAADFLRSAGEVTWAATGAPTYTGIVVTLERWALYAGVAEASTDTVTDAPAEGLPRPPARSEEGRTTPPVGGREKKTELLRRIHEWERQERETTAELEEARRRERGETIQ